MEPAWLSTVERPGTWREVTFRTSVGGVPARVRSPLAPTGRVLVVHDGPEYHRQAALDRYSASGLVPAHHLVLLSPGDREEWYSANTAYGTALNGGILPAVRTLLDADLRVVGMGASLGALAMLHAQVRSTRRFAGLFLQSGSFFVPRHDRHESGFRRYRRIVRFTGDLERGRRAARPVPVAMTAGRAEENLHNNRDMAAALRARGYPVTLTEVDGGHDFGTWRDALDPALTTLLRTVWNR